MKTFSLKYTRSRDRQSVYGYILVGFSFMALTLLTVKTLAPEVTTNAAVQTATQKWGNDTMSLSVDDAAAITVTPGESQMTATSGAKNVTINNTCTDGTTLTMKLAGTETALTRLGSDSLRKDIPATANSTGALSDNSWGYSTDGTNYAAVPASTAAGVVLSSSNSTIGATIPVTFGVRVNNSIPSGVYTNDVVYSATANPNCSTYTLTWNSNGGSAVTDTSKYKTRLNYDEKINLSQLTPTRTGYTLIGWQSSGSSDSSNLTSTNSAANLNPNNAKKITVTAEWTPTIYKITLDQQSGSGGTTAIYEKYATGWYSSSTASASIGTISVPSKTSYVFGGYYTSTGCSGTQRINDSGKIIAGNTTYTAEGTLYACWRTKPVTTMQTFSCSTLSSGTTTTLTDSRDNKVYTVFRGKDGRCWMSQNLRLINKTITSSDSNVSTNFSIPNNNWASNTTESAKLTNAYTYDTENTDYGVYYNYVAATAGTISGESNENDAIYDVCPKGWKLPSMTEQQALLTAYNVSNDATGSATMRAAPLNFVYSGYISYSRTSPSEQEITGLWWSSTASNQSSRFRIDISSNGATVSFNATKRSGYPVRCIAK